jgi:hypothetical protein
MDLGGVSEGALYAVGYLGEIWYREPVGWIQQDSPTNVVLTCVKCVSRDEVYVAGLMGTLLRGTNGQWQVIPQEATKADFWGMAWFGGQMYLSNYDGVFVLRGTDLERIDMGLAPELTTAYLDSRDGVLWSVGPKHLAVTTDGRIWTEIAKP